jgi:hypothetical protein
MWLSSMQATDPYLYGGADTIGCFLSVLISVFARKIRRKSTIQAILTSILYCISLYGTFVYLGTPFGAWMVETTFVICCLSTILGAFGEMA